MDYRGNLDMQYPECPLCLKNSEKGRVTPVRVSNMFMYCCTEEKCPYVLMAGESIMLKNCDKPLFQITDDCSDSGCESVDAESVSDAINMESIIGNDANFNDNDIQSVMDELTKKFGAGAES